MKPHTWHAVVTTSASFATGYHFWNSRTVLGSLVNEIACSLGGALLTNTSNPSLRTNMHRMLLFQYEGLVKKRDLKGMFALITSFNMLTIT
jgi:hypothetical protein